MKTETILAALMAASALMSCNKKDAVPQSARPVSKEAVSIQFMAGGRNTATKADSDLLDIDDEMVNSLSIFVFDEDGRIEASGTSNENSVTLDCTIGSGKKIYAVVNKAVTRTIARAADMEVLVSSLTDNTASNGFVMCGHLDNQAITPSMIDPVHIPVARVAAKVEIKKITNRLRETAFSSTAIRIDDISLINAVDGDIYMFLSEDGQQGPDKWLSRMATGNTASDTYYVHDHVGTSIANGASYSTPHTLFCYPNDTEEDTFGGSWSPRKTRLLITTYIDGVGTRYYPVTFDNISSNTAYTIDELIITRLGAKTPDSEVDTNQLDFTVDVSAWIPYSMGTITI